MGGKILLLWRFQGYFFSSIYLVESGCRKEVRVFGLSFIFGELHNGDAVIALRGLHGSENFSVKPIGVRAAGELRRATCNLCTKSTFAVG